MAVREVNVTVVGNVGADPVAHETNSGSRVTNFSVGSTPRVWDRETESWVDGRTTWYKIACWRELGVNVAESIRRGERVIVTGRLAAENYKTREGEERTDLRVVADNVGHDLTFGTSRFSRVLRNGSVPGQAGSDHGSDDRADEEADLDAVDHVVDPLTGELRSSVPVPV